MPKKKGSPNPQDKPSAEFEKFRDFTRRLMAVPKKEIDKQKAKYEQEKTARTKTG